MKSSTLDKVKVITVDSKHIALDQLPNIAQYEKISVIIKVLELLKTE